MASSQTRYHAEDSNGERPNQEQEFGVYDVETGTPANDVVEEFHGGEDTAAPAQIPITQTDVQNAAMENVLHVEENAYSAAANRHDLAVAVEHPSSFPVRSMHWVDEGAGLDEQPFISKDESRFYASRISFASWKSSAGEGQDGDDAVHSFPGAEQLAEQGSDQVQTLVASNSANAIDARRESVLQSVGVGSTADEAEFPAESVPIDKAAVVQPCVGLGLATIERTLNVRCTQVPGNNLAMRMKTKQKDINSKSFTSIYYSKRPLKSMLNSKIVLLILGIASAGYVIRNTLYWRGAVWQSRQTNKMLRFENLETRDGNSPSTVNIMDFGGLHGGCKVTDEKVETVEHENTFTVIYRNRVTVDGFYFVTSDGPVGLDPVRFAVFGSNNGREWEQFGASDFKIQDDGSRSLRTSAFPTTEVRTKEVKIDHRVPWHWTLGWLGTALAFSGGMSASVFAAYHGRVQQGAALLALSWFLTGIMFIMAAIANGVKSDAIRSVPYLLWASFSFTVAVSFLYSSGRIAFLLILNGLFYTFCIKMVAATAVYEDIESMGRSPPITGFMLIIAGICTYVLLYRHNRRVVEAMAPDKEVYDQIWTQVRCGHGADQALRALEAAANRIIHLGEIRNPVHYNRKPVSRKRKDQLNRVLVEANHSQIVHNIEAMMQGEPHGGTLYTARNAIDRFLHFANDMLGMDGNNIRLEKGFSFPQFVPHSFDKRSPVCSLDQLYAQATVLQPLLRCKVQEWAAQSGGLFPVLAQDSPPMKIERDGNASPSVSSDSGGARRQSMFFAMGACAGRIKYEKWEPELEDRVLWPRMKRVDRAIVKLTRVYAEDVSKLVDVCRSTIVFDNVQDMVKCINAIERDEDTRVLRVKNRMKPWQDADSSGGFRNVILNLILSGGECARYGLENHVCELQLVLRIFAEAMTPERHDRYIQFRQHHRPVEVNLNRLRGWRLSVHHGVKRVSHAVRAVQRSRLAQVLPGAGDGPVNVQNLSIQETVALQRTTVEGDFLDKVLRSGYTLKTANSGSVLFTAKPIETSMCYWQWQALLLIYAVLVYITCFGIWDKWKSADYAPPYSHFRFTNIENRIGEQFPSTVAIQDFGVMRDGCWSTEQVVDRIVGYGAMTVTYMRPVEMNGFYFVTADENTSIDFDPAKIAVHGSADQETWDWIGSSFFRIQDDGNRKLLDGKYNTPKQRGIPVEFNMELPWAWLLSIAGHLPWALALTVIAVCGYLQRTRGATFVFTVGVTCSFVVHFVASIAWYYAGYWQEGVASFLFACGILGVMLIALHRAALLVRWLGLIGVSFCLIDVFRHGVLYRDISGMALNPPITGLVLMLSGLIAVVLRRRIVRAAKSIVDQDQEKYNKLWEELEAQEGAFEELEALEFVAQKLSSTAEEHSAFHTNKVRLAPMRREADGSNQEHYSSLNQQDVANFKLNLDAKAQVGPVEMRLPVKSLDQVYSQAALLQPMLRAKIEQWAGLSGGLFPMIKLPRHTKHDDGGGSSQAKGRQKYIKWSDVANDPPRQSHIAWATLKKVERSVEKLTRVYGEDVSRLVDVCRQSMVFDGVMDIAQCLDAIGKDQEVQVVRVKNRMSRKFNAADSAGFRNVALNLLIVHPDAVKCGVDTHVCEVQLILRQFSDAKSDQGHKRYVRFRNLRGE